jgi:hypothetical protein
MKFCNECKQRLGERLEILSALNFYHVFTGEYTFVEINETETSKKIQEMMTSLEEAGYIVTHEDQDGDWMIIPKNIMPKVTGCHLYCKNKEWKDETDED